MKRLSCMHAYECANYLVSARTAASIHRFHRDWTKPAEAENGKARHLGAQAPLEVKGLSRGTAA
jgi:hypothetical protein